MEGTLLRAQHEQHRKADRKTRVANRKHFAAFEPVRGVPGNRKQQNRRQKLRQPHKAQIERPFRDLVNLPAHGHRLHLDRRHNQKSRNLKQHKSGMSEGGASSSGVVAGMNF